jgi:Zn-dependent peptidase ImmA (M78 family)
LDTSRRTPHGIRAARGHSYATLEREAMNFRQSIQVDPILPVDGLKLYDQIPDRLRAIVNGVAYPVRFRISGLVDGKEAEAQYAADARHYLITLTEDTYLQLEKRQPRAKLSLTHEWAHIQLHAPLLLKLGTLPFHSRWELYKPKRVPHTSARDTEWQANSLATAILMPAVGIRAIESAIPVYRHHTLPDRIQRHFGVSAEAAQYRWKDYFCHRSELLDVAPEKVPTEAPRRVLESKHDSIWADWDSLSSERPK